MGIFPRLPVVPLEVDKEDILCRHIADKATNLLTFLMQEVCLPLLVMPNKKSALAVLIVRRLSRPKHLRSLAVSGIMSQTPRFSSNNLSNHVDDSDNWHDCSPSTSCRSNSEFYEHRSPPRSTKTIPINDSFVESNLGGIGS